MTLNHRKLVRLLQMAYSAEKAAAFAYIGHAQSVKDRDEKTAIRQIEIDEWEHREHVLRIMRTYNVPVSQYYEWKFYFIGKIIAWSCHVIGWFMPFYFAGRLESGNVCEYFRMMHYFDELAIDDHHDILYEMGMKEKEHEVYFLNKLNGHSWMPWFERLFGWGRGQSMNDVDLSRKYPIAESKKYCRAG